MKIITFERFLLVPKPEFDPYSQRLARDVRNSLGHWFVHGLMSQQPDPAGDALSRLNVAALPESHQDWVRRKVRLYRQLAQHIPVGTATSPLELGLELWREGLFFEAHEAFEEAWQSADGDRSLAFKALVQAVGSCIHARRGADGPAKSLAAKAARGLKQYGRSLPEIPWLPQLIAEMQNHGPVEIGAYPWGSN